MVYKEDWEKSQLRYDAFWAGSVADRCCCWITAPRDKPLQPGPAPRQPRDVQQQWLDVEYRLEQTLAGFNRTWFGGDAYPLSWNNLGPGIAAAYMGAGWRLAEDTIWFDTDPPIKDWANRKPVVLDLESPMWKTTWEMTELFSRNAGDNFMVGITDLGGSVDVAASMRGSDVLLYDVYDHPEELKGLVVEIDAAWKQAYDRLQGLMNKYVQGSAAWMGMWCRERWYPLQCDFSAMISRKMFDEFVRPALAIEAGWFDHAIYHLDGPGEIVHLDSVLEIDGIDGIQCVPGTMYQQRTGSYFQSFANDMWMPVMRKIQASGKRLVLNNIHTCELDDLIQNIRPEGLFITMDGQTEAEARELEKRIARWK